MGKLIKNHWARLIILSAAACKLTMTWTDRSLLTLSYRSDCGCHRVLLLAQDLLGLPYAHPRWCSKTDTGFTNNKSTLGAGHASSRMASQLRRRLSSPPLARIPTCHPSSHSTQCCSYLPRHKRRYLLPHRHDRLLLGLQRRRG